MATNEVDESVIRAAMSIVRDAYNPPTGFGDVADLGACRAKAEHGVETLLSQINRVKQALSISAPDQVTN